MGEEARQRVGRAVFCHRTARMKAKRAENRAQNKSGNENREENSAAVFEDSMTKQRNGNKEGGVDNHAEADLTPDEAEALKKLLASDTSQSASGGDGDGGKEGEGGDEGQQSVAADVAQAGTRDSSDQRHPRLERQVFVGGLPVDVTSTMFRTWADSVFPGRVINAVLVSVKERAFEAVPRSMGMMNLV